MAKKPISILFVCMGNICRSPMVEGVFRHHIEQLNKSKLFHVDSAGTGNWHEGGLPDTRSIETMNRYNIDITEQRSRPVIAKDFERFDLIFAMDHDNLDFLISRSPIETQSKIHLFMDYACTQDIAIPDPYYGQGDGFDRVYHMLVKGCGGLLERLEP